MDIYVTGNVSYVNTDVVVYNKIKTYIMKKIFILYFLVIGYFTYSQNTSLEWSTQASVVSEGRVCTVDNLGNIFIVGSIEGGMYFTKIDSIGNNLWEKQFISGSPTDGGFSIICDSENNVLIAGAFRETIHFQDTILTALDVCDIFIVKFDNDGEFIWAKSEGGNSWDWGYSLCVDINDNLYVTGYFYETAYFSGHTVTANYSSDIFIAKYTSDGQFVWIKHYGGEEDFFANSGNSIIADSNSNIYVTGRFGGNISFGNYNFTSDGSRDVFLMKMDLNGNIIWVRAFGSQSHWDNGFSVATDILGNVYVTADFYNTVTIDGTTITTSEDDPTLIAKFNNSGVLCWMNYIINTGWSSTNRYNKAIFVNNPNNVYVYGTYRSSYVFNDSNYDIFLVKYNENGALQWHETYTGNDSNKGNFITSARDSAMYLLGSYSDTLLLSDGILFSEFNTSYLGKIYDLTYDSTYTNNIDPYNNESDEIKIYPNPTNQYVDIIYYDLQYCTLKLIDIQGKILKNIKCESNQISLDLTSINSGLYYLIFINGNMVMTKKIVKI